MSFFRLALLACLLPLCAAAQPRPDTIIEDTWTTAAGPAGQRLTFAQLEKTYGRFAAPVYDVTKTLARLEDSLKKAGIDSMLVYRRHDNYWLSDHRFVMLQKKQRLPLGLQPVASAEPAYLFWVQKGRYRVMKLDQFSVSAVVERPAAQEYVLYDFYGRNRDSLASGHDLDAYRDTFAYAAGYDNVFYPQVETAHYNYAPYVIDASLRGCGSSSIDGQLDTATFHFYINKWQAEPHAGNTSEGPHMRYGNSTRRYYTNFMLRKNEWSRIFESEVLTLETSYFR